MRILRPEDLEARKRKLLQAVIYHYIQTGSPVGSQTLVDKCRFGFSSATIRNLLSELEEDGFLHQPHTSAGRIPTDKGYRLYVDSLIDLQRLAAEEEMRIRVEYDRRMQQIQDIMISTSQLLSNVSKYCGFVLPQRQDQSKLRHVQLVSLSPTQILVVMVSNTGTIIHRLLEIQKPIPVNRLLQINNLLNERLYSKRFSDIQSQILNYIEEAQAESTEVFDLAKTLADEAFDFTRPDNLYVEGTQNMVTLPDFEDIEQMRNVLTVIDSKDLLISAVQRRLGEQGLQVRIGAENRTPEMRDLSVVSATYEMQGRPVGVLGIIGPRRMDYQRVMAVVSEVSELVNERLQKLKTDDE